MLGSTRVVDRCVGAREDECLVAGVEPAHDVRWRAVLAADLEDLPVPLVVVHMCAAHVDPVTDCGLHGFSSLGALDWDLDGRWLFGGHRDAHLEYPVAVRRGDL